MVSCSSHANAIGLGVLTIDASPVHADPAILGGTLVFLGTRVPAQTLLDYLHDGGTLAGFLEDFPSVKRVDAQTFLQLAGEQSATAA
jgi:uncharacterized protein (DUF433 family)